MRRNQQAAHPELSKNELIGAKALDKYGPGGLQGDMNAESYKLKAGISALPFSYQAMGTQFKGKPGFADGGIIEGPGTGTSDSIPSREPIGGAIIPADVVALYGQAYFDKLEAAAPKSKDDNGKIEANVSDGEFRLSPEAVKYWGEDAINKLIDSDNESMEPGMMDDAPKLGVQGYAVGGMVSSPEPEPDPRYQPIKPSVAPPPPTLSQRLFGTGTGPSPLEQLTGALSGKAQKPGYAEGGIVEPGQSTREFWRNAPQSPVPTPGIANPANPAEMMKARLATSGAAQQAQTQALRQQMPNLGARPATPNAAPSISRITHPASNGSVAPRLGLAANAVDSGTVGNVAHDLVSDYDYQNPELKGKMQAMFPKPTGYAKGGVVRPGTEPEDPETYVPQTATGVTDVMKATAQGLQQKGIVGSAYQGAKDAANILGTQSTNFGKNYIEGGKNVLGGLGKVLIGDQGMNALSANNASPAPAQPATQPPALAQAQPGNPAPMIQGGANPNRLAELQTIAQGNQSPLVEDPLQQQEPARQQAAPPQLNQGFGAKPQLNMLGQPVQTLDENGFYTVGSGANQAKVLPWKATSDDALQRTLTKEQYLAQLPNQIDSQKLTQQQREFEANQAAGTASATAENQFKRDELKQKASIEQAKLDAPEYGIVPGQEDAANPVTYQKRGKPVETGGIDAQYEGEMSKLDPQDPNYDRKHIALTKQWLTMKQQARQGQ